MVIGVNEEEDEFIFTLGLQQQALLHLLSLKNDKHRNMRTNRPPDRKREERRDTHGDGQDPAHSRPSQTKAHLQHRENLMSDDTQPSPAHRDRRTDAYRVRRVALHWRKSQRHQVDVQSAVSEITERVQMDDKPRLILREREQESLKSCR